MAAGIAEVWVVDLKEECIYVYRKPGPGGYAEVICREVEEQVEVEDLLEVGAFGVSEIID